MILVFYWLFTLNEKEEEKEENRQRQPKIRLNDARNVIITWIYVVFFTQIGHIIVCIFELVHLFLRLNFVHFKTTNER